MVAERVSLSPSDVHNPGINENVALVLGTQTGHTVGLPSSSEKLLDHQNKNIIPNRSSSCRC